jgi:hypothetical protein
MDPVEVPDSRNRPVVLEAGSPADAVVRRRPRPRTLLGLFAAAVIAAGGVLAGSWSLWAAVNPVPPNGTPAPLWFSPPAPVITTTEDTPPPITAPTHEPTHGTAPTSDDHGGAHTATTGPTSTQRGRGGDDPPGDDHGGGRGGGKGSSGP